MGCVFLKPEKPAKIFKVVNIDEKGHDYLHGKIEVTSEYLVLHLGKKGEIRWPIRTLRRYGYTDIIFKFEAGRRCPTGEGLFAFRCVQAEQLFRLLQRNVQSTYSIVTTPKIPARNTSSSDSESQLIVATVPGYENCKKEAGCTNSYLELIENSAISCQSISEFDSPMDDNEGGQFSKNIQYVIVMVLSEKPSAPVLETSTHENNTSVDYSTIDTQKTEALHRSIIPSEENDLGCMRRTRHNFNTYSVQG